MIDIVLCWDTWEPICFKPGMMLDMTRLILQFDSRLIDHEVHSETQGQRKARTCAVILL